MDEKDRAQESEVQQEVLLDGQGRRAVDDNGEPIHWATKGERVIAFVLALIVIGITIAMAYSIAVGDFFRW